jgi:hypothetical protein
MEEKHMSACCACYIQGQVLPQSLQETRYLQKGQERSCDEGGQRPGPPPLFLAHSVLLFFDGFSMFTQPLPVMVAPLSLFFLLFLLQSTSKQLLACSIASLPDLLLTYNCNCHTFHENQVWF